MLLVIPSIDIRHQKCYRLVKGLPGVDSMYSDDPVEIAKLWRRENSKCLHVVDLDGVEEGRIKNAEMIRQIVNSVDIPVQLGGHLESYQEITNALANLGVYRVAVSAHAGTKVIQRLIEENGARKVVVSIEAKDGFLEARGQHTDDRLPPVKVAAKLKEVGVCRLLYSDFLQGDSLHGPNFESIRTLAEETGLRITVSGGVRGLEDLLKLQEFEPLGVDSVIVGRALYENRFACQGLWRDVEAEESRVSKRGS